MKRAIRSLLVLLNLLALCLYGAVTQAMAGMATGVSEIVICGENGPETIRMTPEGTPAKSPHDCGKCLACLACSSGDPARPAVVPQPAADYASFEPDWTTQLVVIRFMPRPQTRGPPPRAAEWTFLAAAAAGMTRGPSVLAQDRRANNEVAR